MSLSSLIRNVLQLTSTWSPYYHYLPSRALRYTNGKWQSYGTTDTGCIFFFQWSANSSISVASWLLLRFLTQMENMWKDQLFLKILPEKHIQGILAESELKSFSRIWPWTNSRDQPRFHASVLYLIRYSHTSSSLKATYTHMCKSVSIHTPSVTLGCSQWILLLYL